MNIKLIFSGFIFSVSFLLLFSLESRSQINLKNAIAFSTVLNIVPENEGRYQSIYNQFGFSYERRFNHITLNSYYGFWNERVLVTDHFQGALYEIFNIDSSEWVGLLASRFKYQFIDLVISYQISPIKNVSVAAGLGPSYTWGTNSYISSYFYSSGIPDWVIQYEQKEESRLGGIVQLQANYFLFKNRINAGLNFKERIYPNYYRQFDAGIQLGVNF